MSICFRTFRYLASRADFGNIDGMEADATVPLVLKRVSELQSLARNSRLHSAAQIEQLCALIKEFGFASPTVADDRSVLAGHGRLMAARKLYAEGETIRLPDGTLLPQGTVPVVSCQGWSEEKRRVYAIADNKVGLNSTWDYSALAADLKALQNLPTFNQKLLPFSSVELHALTGERILPVLDGAPATADPPSSAQEEWKGVPEYEGLPPCFRKIVVNFENAAAVDAFFAAIGHQYGPKTKSIWYPHKEHRDLKSLRYGSRKQPK